MGRATAIQARTARARTARTVWMARTVTTAQRGRSPGRVGWLTGPSLALVGWWGGARPSFAGLRVRAPPSGLWLGGGHGQLAGELVDLGGVVAAVAAEGALVGEPAVLGPAADGLGRHAQPLGDLGGGQVGAAGHRVHLPSWLVGVGVEAAQVGPQAAAGADAAAGVVAAAAIAAPVRVVAAAPAGAERRQCAQRRVDGRRGERGERGQGDHRSAGGVQAALGAVSAWWPGGVLPAPLLVAARLAC